MPDMPLKLTGAGLVKSKYSFGTRRSARSLNLHLNTQSLLPAGHVQLGLLEASRFSGKTVVYKQKTTSKEEGIYITMKSCSLYWAKAPDIV